MQRSHKINYFEMEGRDNLPQVIKHIKSFLRGMENQGVDLPRKIVFLTRQGEGPLLAYNQLQSEDIQIIAVTFPKNFSARHKDGSVFIPEIPPKLRQFFDGVGIQIVTNRLPFDDIIGAEAHNREMHILRDTLALFGGSMPLAIQAVLQAADAGLIEIGEQVVAVTGDAAILVTASTTQMFMRHDEFGLSVNEIICKPRIFTRSRRPSKKSQNEEQNPLQIEGKITRRDIETS